MHPMPRSGTAPLGQAAIPFGFSDGRSRATDQRRGLRNRECRTLLSARFRIDRAVPNEFKDRKRFPVEGTELIAHAFISLRVEVGFFRHFFHFLWNGFPTLALFVWIGVD